MTLDNSFFRKNRRMLAEQLGGGLLVMTAYDVMQSSADMTHEFDFESNFYYLAGIKAARWRMIYDSARDYCYLVRPDISEVERVFNGMLADDEALETSGADTVLSFEDFEGLLRELKRRHNLVYTVTPEKNSGDIVLNPAAKNLATQLERIFPQVDDCRQKLAKLRAIKQPIEIELMKRAANLSVSAFQDVRKKIDTYNYEYEIEADFTASFRRQNARHAYEPIVAAAEHAVTLHYIENAAKLRRRSLVLIDIGARHDAYASDITRTYAYGQVTKRQKTVHEAVRAAQQQIIALLGPELRVDEYQRKVDNIMGDTCRMLGLGASADVVEAARRYMPHAVSHGLGIDTHDSLGHPMKLQPNMVLTVEPGIYIPEEGIGVRIEDDILITETGHVNLTSALSTEL